MNKKALAIALAITTTIAIVLGLVLTSMIYYPLISLYIIFGIISLTAFTLITYFAYLFITEEFNI